MSKSVEASSPDAALLPDEDHTLVHISKLVRGQHNPRNETPKQELKQSVAGSGISDPLIVRPDPSDDVYHITDGWQRYQAAVDNGWEMLPVQIYETTMEALDKTKLASIGRREWDRYAWAKFSQSMANEIRTEGDSKMDVVNSVADELDLRANTVRRYLNVLQLPQVIHPLLTIGPDGTSKQWAQLKAYNEDVRQYSGLRLRVADRLATVQSSIGSDERVIAIAASAVEFPDPEDAIEFINLAAEDDDQRLDMIRREVLVGNDHSQYLTAPRVAVKLPAEKKQAVMEHCHQQRRPLSDIVSETIKSLADELCETEDTTDEDVSDAPTPEDQEET